MLNLEKRPLSTSLLSFLDSRKWETEPRREETQPGPHKGESVVFGKGGRSFPPREPIRKKKGSLKLKCATRKLGGAIEKKASDVFSILSSVLE